jgi:hypothetical protein
VRLQDDSLSRQAGVTMPIVLDIPGGDNIFPSVAPAARSNLFLNPASMDHIVRAVVVGMTVGASSTAPRSGRIVTIVQWVRCMRGIGCMTYCGEEDVEVAELWLKKRKKDGTLCLCIDYCQ